MKKLYFKNEYLQFFCTECKKVLMNVNGFAFLVIPEINYFFCRN